MATMSEAEMEKYAQLLDELCEKDPQAYEQFIQMMKDQVEQATKGEATSTPPSPESMLDMIKQAANKGSGESTAATEEAFKPQFPGNKVMETNGLAAKQEGMYIEVTPGFVMKTKEIKTQKKVFVNVCFSDAIQTFSQRKQLDDEGKEQEGIHVPLSLGAPHEVQDKSGNTSLAFDVAVNTQVIDDCKTDKTGAFRNFVCELAIEYIDQKYKIKLDARYKLPKLTYRGDLPPPKHYIRKTQKPIIEEVSKSTVKPIKPVERKPTVKKTAHAQHTIFELTRREQGEESRQVCTRVAAVDVKGAALSRDSLNRAGTHLAVQIRFETPVTNPEDLELDLRAEHLTVRAVGHVDHTLYLPYPVIIDQAEVTLDRNQNVIEVVAAIDKSWELYEPDCGSAPWLLAQALREEEDNKKGTAPSASQESEPEPKSLVDMFHLAMPSDQSGVSQSEQSKRTAKWDPVDEDEELPEDRFHRKDMMSMHILEQRKKEREQKAKEADEKRKAQRADVEEKQRKAREAGKTWREMYPNEPETTYIDMEDIVANERRKREQDAAKDSAMTNEKLESEVAAECMLTEAAVQAAAAWSVDKKENGLDLASALAFELLE